MAISTLDGVLAGMQPPQFYSKTAGGTMVGGRPHSYWTIGGFPAGGGTQYSTTAAGAAITNTTYPGAIYHNDPVTGNAYLARFQGIATIAGSLLLCDRLWQGGGLSATITTAQTVNSATFPARDTNGTTNGTGVYVAMEISGAATSSVTSTLTMSYTNQAGTSGRSATNVDLTSNGALAIGAFIRMGLQSGDTGVRSIQSFTIGTSLVSGTVNLVAYRVLAALEIQGALIPNAVDALTSGFPQLYNGTTPFLVFIPSTTTTTAISGQYIETQG